MTTTKDSRPGEGAASWTNTTIDHTGRMLAAAVEYAEHHWQVFPLNGKAPAIPKPHPKASRCRGECGLHGHGLFDATDDVDQVSAWWSGRYRGCNIGCRVPKQMFVLDPDGPNRNPPGRGMHALARLEERHGPLPPTLTQITGSGGLHLFFRRPTGLHLSKAAAARVGLEFKDHGGYVVLAPSKHPDSGETYVWCDHPMAAPPTWLVRVLTEPERTHTAKRHGSAGRFSGVSITDFERRTSWADILEPHGWTCLDADPDADGARWLHPRATSSSSATIRNGTKSRLYVYTPNTDFEQTAAGDRRGYSKFDAHAVLNFNGDISAAARSLRGRAA